METSNAAATTDNVRWGEVLLANYWFGDKSLLFIYLNLLKIKKKNSLWRKAIIIRVAFGSNPLQDPFRTQTRWEIET